MSTDEEANLVEGHVIGKQRNGGAMLPFEKDERGDKLLEPLLEPASRCSTIAPSPAL